MGHILVDFDRTLAHYESWARNGTALGLPIPEMQERVKRWLAEGKDVRIFTARAVRGPDAADMVELKRWCKRHLGQELPIQNWKDFETEEIWDDLAVSITPNEGSVTWRLDVAELDKPLPPETIAWVTKTLNSIGHKPEDSK